MTIFEIPIYEELSFSCTNASKCNLNFLRTKPLTTLMIQIRFNLLSSPTFMETTLIPPYNLTLISSLVSVGLLQSFPISCSV